MEIRVVRHARLSRGKCVPDTKASKRGFDGVGDETDNGGPGPIAMLPAAPVPALVLAFASPKDIRRRDLLRLEVPPPP